MFPEVNYTRFHYSRIPLPTALGSALRLQGFLRPILRYFSLISSFEGKKQSGTGKTQLKQTAKKKLEDKQWRISESETELHHRMSHTHKDWAQLVACSVTSVRTQGHESPVSEGNT